jgi:hypothetical protein
MIQAIGILFVNSYLICGWRNAAVGRVPHFIVCHAAKFSRFVRTGKMRTGAAVNLIDLANFATCFSHRRLLPIVSPIACRLAEPDPVAF